MKKSSSVPPHTHNHKTSSRPHPLAAFFNCCLGDEPAPLSPKIQDLRAQLKEFKTEDVQIIPGQPVTITKDMIIGDVIANFPKTTSIFEEIHPLGLLSPLLKEISIEMFLADLNINADQVCSDLTFLINT